MILGGLMFPWISINIFSVWLIWFFLYIVARYLLIAHPLLHAAAAHQAGSVCISLFILFWLEAILNCWYATHVSMDPSHYIVYILEDIPSMCSCKKYGDLRINSCVKIKRRVNLFCINSLIEVFYSVSFRNVFHIDVWTQPEALLVLMG